MSVDINYELVRSKRKSIAIYVHRDGRVEVRAPNRMPKYEIEAFVNDKRHWVLNKQAEWLALPQKSKPTFTEGSTHYFLGEPHQLTLCKPESDQALIHLRVKSRTEQGLSQALDRWYRQQAEPIFFERHNYWRQSMVGFNLPESTLAQRKMKRRWGSCNSKGKITLNTQLVRYPLACVDAVIVHELCHLLEFNHSPRFYRLMDQAYPNWKAIDKLLKQLSYQY